MAVEKEPSAKPNTAEKPIMVDVKIVRDTWEGEVRKVAGTVIQVPLPAAMWGIYEGLFRPDGKSPFATE